MRTTPASTTMEATALRLRISRCQAPGGAGVVEPREFGVSLIKFDPPIEQGVGDIDHQVEDNQHDAVNDHHPAEHEDVEVQDRIDEITAHPGDIKNGLDDNRAGEEV